MFKKRYTFWLDDINVLKKYDELLPTNKMTFVEQLNALTRLCILIIIILCVFGKTDLLSLPITVIILIIVIYYIFESDSNGKKKELDRIIPKSNYSLPEIREYENATRIMPTVDNPFMNPTIENFNTENKHINPISYDDIDKDELKIDEKINEAFNVNLYKNIEDVFDNKNSQRQFFTVARNIPNDQEAFAKWCYNFPDTCKVDQSRCLRYQDYRWPDGQSINTNA